MVAGVFGSYGSWSIASLGAPATTSPLWQDPATVTTDTNAPAPPFGTVQFMVSGDNSFNASMSDAVGGA